ncbi:MAG: ABC transporter permease subunit [Holosporales bacterium]|nr:ABC transporter permease subunit [Holosporales bacterium]
MIKTSKVVTTCMIFGLVFLYTPIVTLIMSSFNSSEIPGIWTRFSLRWFKAVLEDEDLIHAGIVSLKIATISATGSVILGVLSAIATSSCNGCCRRLLGSLMIIPVIMPEIIIGFSLLMLFMVCEDVFGIPAKRGVVTVTIGHIMTTVAYVHMTVRSRLISFDKSIEEAALDLGARPLWVFIRVKLPVIGRSIITGWILAFTLSLDDLVIASFLTGPGATTLPILIFSNVRVGVTPAISAFATMFIGVILVCGLLSFLISRNSKPL